MIHNSLHFLIFPNLNIMKLKKLFYVMFYLELRYKNFSVANFHGEICFTSIPTF